jgi:acyl carrier protein
VNTRRHVKDTEATVRRVLCEQLGVNMGELAPERSLADLGADSLDHIEMAMALEEEFTIEIDDEELERVTTVGQAIDLVKRKLDPEATVP